MPFVFVIWVALVEPSALIRKISLLTSPEHVESRGGRELSKAVKPIHVLSGLHMGLSRSLAALPLFELLVTRVTVRVAGARE